MWVNTTITVPSAKSHEGGLGQGWHARAGSTLACSSPPLAWAGPYPLLLIWPRVGIVRGGGVPTGSGGAGMAGQTPTPGPGLAQS
jgi:hypothetical protein